MVEASSLASNMTPPEDDPPAARFDDPALGDDVDPLLPPAAEGPEALFRPVDEAGLFANL